MKTAIKPLVVAMNSLLVSALSVPLMAEDDILSLEEMVVVGSRSNKPRSVADSPVPVDVISEEDIGRFGNTADVTDLLKTMVPSYTATPATGDGSAFVRPTSLRGMAPDQTLVLVNGKRRHRSALVHFFAPAAGNGAHGADIGMVPSIALDHVEVLRDGAASQYGSDAIAGVINFVTKDDAEGGEVQLQYGQYYEGEESIKFAVNAGFALGPNGFMNLSLEHIDNEALSRGDQRPDAQALIDGGVTGIGADTPFDDEPLAQTWGRPETSGTRLFLNSGIELSPAATLYLQSNYAETEGRYRFFYRNPSHSSIAALQAIDPSFEIPTGYTPYLDGDQTDFSIVTGVKGLFPGDWFYDFSVGYGENELDYFLNNTLNPSLGLVNGQPPKRDFDVGAYTQEEVNLNADFSKAITDSVNLAFGAEWREETYIVTPGEPDSYEGSGSNGLAGFRPEDSGSFDRDNYALYVDMEQEVSDSFFLQYALRYEDFSDFGDTTNGKIAARFNATEALTFRGAISTGFHAPTPGQANVRTTITTFDGATGLQVEEGLVRPTSPQAIGAGGAALKEEESLNFSIGAVIDFTSYTNLTIDFYQIDVDDRIYRSGDRQVILDGGEYRPCDVGDDAADCQTISFYTNALDLTHKGVDLVLTSGIDWAGVTTDLSFAFSYNDVEVKDQTQINGQNPVNDATVEDIENNFPNERFVLSGNTQLSEQWHWMLRFNYYGKHYDERGEIGAETNPSKEIGQTVFVDTEVSYQPSDNIRFALGAVNLFDEYVDEIDEPYANRRSVGLPYPRRSAANYEGGSWYLRGSYFF